MGKNIPEEPPEGSVVRFLTQISLPSDGYLYAALRIKDQWYLTAGTGPHYPPMSWEKLVEFAAGVLGNYNIQVARGWTLLAKGKIYS